MVNKSVACITHNMMNAVAINHAVRRIVADILLHVTRGWEAMSIIQSKLNMQAGIEDLQLHQKPRLHYILILPPTHRAAQKLEM